VHNGSARGSLLFGSGSQFGSATAPDLINGGVNAVGTNSQTSVMPVGEIELGSEVFYNWGRFRLFGQVGVVGQAWWGAGNASQGLNLAASTPTFPTTTGQGNNTLGFIGGVARVGLSF